MESFNITMSHSSTPYDVVGEMFKLKLHYYTHVITLPTTLTQASLLPDPAFCSSRVFMSLQKHAVCSQNSKGASLAHDTYLTVRTFSSSSIKGPQLMS